MQLSSTAQKQVRELHVVASHYQSMLTLMSEAIKKAVKEDLGIDLDAHNYELDTESGELHVRPTE